MEFVVTCLPGVGPLLADELGELGITVTDQGNAHAGIAGLQQDALKVCLWSRLAERVLLPLATVQGTPDETPDRLAAEVDWGAVVQPGTPVYLSLDHGKGVRGDSRISARRLRRTLPATLEAGRREEGALTLRARIDADEAGLWLDLAGTPLHRRGYRLAGGRAPLRENLAAAVLRAGGWHRAERPSLLLDPFCGSGTLLIEGAWMAAGVAPGALRRQYGFMAWRDCRRALWEEAMAAWSC